MSLVASPLHGILLSSAMMTLVGLASWMVMRTVKVNSWRLRSLLAAAVLLQGLMFVRLPLYLGLIDSPVDTQYEPLSADAMPAIDYESGEVGLASTSGGMLGERIAESPTHWLSIDWASVDWLYLLAAIWMVVVVVMTTTLAWRYTQLLRLVDQLDEAPCEWRRPWHSLLKQSSRYKFLGGRKSVVLSSEMLVSDSVGPLLVRRLRGNVLIVPRDFWSQLSEEQRRGVMLHELAHLQRGDIWRQLIARGIVVLHWFNPLAWWAMRQYEMATECACDQRVSQQGRKAAAGFASALVQLVQWHGDQQISPTQHFPVATRDLGFQAMAAPPLSTRVSRLLNSSETSDSMIKRFFLVAIAIALVATSAVQVRLSTAQETEASKSQQLRVLDDETEARLTDIAQQFDQSDGTTKRFAQLMKSKSGKIAIAGMLNSLTADARNELKDQAIPRFVEHHFASNPDGKWTLREESKESAERWVRRSKRLGNDIKNLGAAMKDLASKLDTSDEAGAIFHRLLNDPQAPVAVLVSEMGGGDVVTRFIGDALDKALVDTGNGTFVIVDSQRAKVQQLVDQFVVAAEIEARLKRELPVLAPDYVTDDEKHRSLVNHLKSPLMATVLAMQLGTKATSASGAVNELHKQLDRVSTETSKGMRIDDEETWTKLQELFGRVDRVQGILPRVQERLAEIADTIKTDDETERKFASVLRTTPIAIQIAAEIPYADANAGDEFRALISEVTVQSGDRISVDQANANDLLSKAAELLKVCRRIRRYASEISSMLDKLDDQSLVKAFGDAGPYTLLNEIRLFAERHQPDAIGLMREQVFEKTTTGMLVIRSDRREAVRKLIEQADRVSAEAENNDF